MTYTPQVETTPVSQIGKTIAAGTPPYRKANGGLRY